MTEKRKNKPALFKCKLVQIYCLIDLTVVFGYKFGDL